MTDAIIRNLFSKNLKRIRTSQGISQLSLANMTGLTLAFINDIENGKKWISPNTIARFCKALKMEAFHFFLSDEELEGLDKTALSTYMNDLSSIVESSVSEFKNEYLTNNLNDED
jgi:transcriptional regulator with XRE-family HTH domain